MSLGTISRIFMANDRTILITGLTGNQAEREFTAK